VPGASSASNTADTSVASKERCSTGPTEMLSFQNVRVSQDASKDGTVGSKSSEGLQIQGKTVQSTWTCTTVL
jgi:hypothetical protein